MHDNELYFLLGRVSRLMRRGHHHQHARTGQERLLRLIFEHEGVNARELAEILDVRPSSMTAKLDRLSEAGWIERRPSPSDARMLEVHVTEEGRRILEQNDNGDDTLSKDLFACLSESEQEQFRALCQKLCQAWETEEGKMVRQKKHESRDSHEHHRGGRRGHREARRGDL